MKKTLNPYWNESFDLYVCFTHGFPSFLLTLLCSQVTNQSVIAVQVFDQKKFKKKDQGFLGVINVQVSNIFDLDVGGDGELQQRSMYYIY